VGGQPHPRALGSQCCPRDFLPDVNSLAPLLVLLASGEERTARPEVVGDGTLGRENTRGVAGGLTPRQAPLPLARWRRGVFGTVVERARLAMFHPRPELPFGRPITAQLIGDDHRWDERQAFAELADEHLGGPLGAPALHQEVEQVALLLYCPPQIVAFTLEGEKHFISRICRARFL